MAIFTEDHTYLDMTFDDKFALFHFVAEELKKDGFVEDDYEEALAEREKVFPTGLRTEHFGVAIPHCDAEHVKKQCISFFRLAKAIPFNEMGSEGDEVDCQFAFVLSIKNPQKQVPVLVALANLIQDQGLMEELTKLDSKQAICEKLNERFEDIS
jgi:PTS system galactitol-specific IIA component